MNAMAELTVVHSPKLTDLSALESLELALGLERPMITTGVMATLQALAVSNMPHTRPR